MVEIYRDKSNVRAVFTMMLLLSVAIVSYFLVRFFRASTAVRAYQTSPGCALSYSPGDDSEKNRFCSVAREKITHRQETGSFRFKHDWITVSNGVGRTETVEAGENGFFSGHYSDYFSLGAGDMVEVQRFGGIIMKITDGDSVVITRSNPESEVNKSKNGLFTVGLVGVFVLLSFFRRNRIRARNAVTIDS